MLKKSTLLFIGTFFLLFIGLSDYGYGHHRPGHGGGPGDDDGGEAAEYSVTITGAVSGGSDAPWTETSGGKNIQGDYRSGDFGHLDLSFFTMSYPYGPFTGSRGENCFGSAPVSLYPQAAIARGRGGRAEGRFWFWGSTDNEDSIPVLYQFIVLGLFDKSTSTGWPPLVTTSAEMTDWVMNPSGEGGNTNISCAGESEEEDGFQVEIVVERTNP